APPPRSTLTRSISSSRPRPTRPACCGRSTHSNNWLDTGTDEMQKFIHITDTHFVPPGNLLYGLNPIDRLALCVADVNKHHPDAAFAILTGDLAHKGQPEAYDALKR